MDRVHIVIKHTVQMQIDNLEVGPTARISAPHSSSKASNLRSRSLSWKLTCDMCKLAGVEAFGDTKKKQKSGTFYGEHIWNTGTYLSSLWVWQDIFLVKHIVHDLTHEISCPS